MNKPELVFVVGCNAAGKSTFIRTRLNLLEGFEIFMTDVYKDRTKDLVKLAIGQKKNIILETVFNDLSFKDLADMANNAGYRTSLVVLFLDSLQQSKARATLRGKQQSGITISGSNIDLNFKESFKNVATYFLYFDRSDFIYTGNGEVNELIMSFQHAELLEYHATDLSYPQKFAGYGYQMGRLDKDVYDIIVANKQFAKNASHKDRL